MFQRGHIGLTVGLASAGSVYWLRKRVLEQIASSEERLSFQQRVRRRSKYALAGLAFTGCATAVSASIDSVEKSLGYVHRTAGHSVPILGGLYAGAKLAKRRGIDFVQWACEQVGYGSQTEPILGALDDLATWILDGGITGALTHILGDIPTKGQQGFAALNVLYPISDVKINTGVISAMNIPLNNAFYKGGAILAAASWAVSGVYLTTPEPPKSLLQNSVNDIVDRFRESIHVKSLRRQAEQDATRFIEVLREFVGTTSHSGSISTPPLHTAVDAMGRRPLENESIEGVKEVSLDRSVSDGEETVPLFHDTSETEGDTQLNESSTDESGVHSFLSESSEDPDVRPLTKEPQSDGSNDLL